MNVKKMREKAGLTQQELADKVGVTRRTIINWESKNSVPHSVFSTKLERIFR